MVRISTTYDKDLKQKVFLVRGDESYTKTTDTILTVNDTYENAEDSAEGYRVGLEINILRDIGASSIVVYDYDDVLGVYDCDDEDDTITIGDSTSGGFLLAYGVPHRLWVKYNGNAYCLGSKSRSYNKTYPLPSEYETEITFSNPNASISDGATYNSNVTLTVGGASSSALYNTDIIIYVDDVPLDDPIKTGSSSNVASLSLSGLTNGLHTITAEVLETSAVHSGSKTTQVSVGVIVDFLEYPSTVYSNGKNKFKGRVRDYIGNTINTGTMTLCNTNGTSLATASVSNNVATIEYNNATDHTDNQAVYKLKYGDVYSEPVTMSYNSLESIELSGVTIRDGDIVPINTGSTLSLRYTVYDSNHNVAPNQPVSVVYNSVSQSSTTNSDGIAIVDISLNGKGRQQVTATSSSLTNSNYVQDYMVYWHLEYGSSNTFEIGEMSYSPNRSSSGYLVKGDTSGYLVKGDTSGGFVGFITVSDAGTPTTTVSEMSFVVKNATKIIPIIISDDIVISPSYFDNPISLSKNAQVNITYTGSSTITMTVKANNSTIGTRTLDIDTDSYRIGYLIPSNTNIYFNDLKVSHRSS